MGYCIIMNLIYAIKPMGKNLIKSVTCEYTNTGVHYTGVSPDGYDDTFLLPLDNKDRVLDWFDYVFVGNETVSVKFDVVNTIWSFTSGFALVCAQKEYNPNILTSNDLIVLLQTVDGFISLSKHDDIVKYGFNPLHISRGVNFK